MKLRQFRALVTFVGLAGGCSGAVVGPGAPAENAGIASTNGAHAVEMVRPKRLSYHAAPTVKSRLAAAARKLATPDGNAGSAAAMLGTPTITYNKGPLLQNVEIYAVFWGPNVNAEVVSGIPSFLPAFATSPLMQQINEYNKYNGADTGYTIGAGSFKGAVVDTDAPMPAAGSNLTDLTVRAEISRLIDSGKLPANSANNIFVMFFPAGVSIDQGGGQLSCQVFCGYHDVFSRNGNDAYYAIIPDHYSNGCDQYCGPEKAHLDNLYRTVSHELSEAITDPSVGSGYYDQTWDEIGDICANFDGKSANFAVQSEWSQAVKGCRDHAPTTASGAAVTVAKTSLGTALAGGQVVYTITSTGSGSGTLTLEAPDLDLSASTGFNGQFSSPTIPINGSGTLTLTVPTGVLSYTLPFHLGGQDADGAHYFQMVDLGWKGGKPTLTGATPASAGSQGGNIELDGTNISPGATIFVCATSTCAKTGRVAANANYVSGSSGTKIDVLLPSHAAGKLYVGLQNPNDTTVVHTAFTYTAGAAPMVANVDPPAGAVAGGDQLTVSGSNFGINATVSMGGTALVAGQAYLFLDDKTLLLITPAGTAGAADIVITNADGQTGKGTFTYGGKPTPGIDSLSLATGPTAGGQYITIFGHYFDAAPTVTLDNVAAKVQTIDPDFVGIVTPPHAAGQVNLVLANSDGSTAMTTYTYSDSTGGSGGDMAIGPDMAVGPDMAGGGGGGSGGSGGAGNGNGGGTTITGSNGLKGSSGCAVAGHGADGGSGAGALALLFVCLALVLLRRRA
jgi:hypothetical protein